MTHGPLWPPAAKIAARDDREDQAMQSQTVGDQLTSTLNRIPMGLAIRGVVAIAFGVLILAFPNISLSTLVYLVAAFAAVDGVVSLVLAFSPMPTSARVWLVVNAIAGIGVGVITVLQPNITELALLYVVGAWAIILGAIQIVAAFSGPLDGSVRILTFVYGIVSIAFGVIIFVRPGTGALGLLALIAAYAIATGVALIGVAWELRSSAKEVREAVDSAMSQRQSPGQTQGTASA
jgi:uncharacterized membrane protein HdeD (DUF308 family)